MLVCANRHEKYIRFAYDARPEREPLEAHSVMAIRNAFYAQSGGVTAVINASACGGLQTARAHSDKIGEVFAGRSGIIGALRAGLIDTSLEVDAEIAALRLTPGRAFGSGRYKRMRFAANRA